MSYWRHKMVDGTEFWISCKRPAFLSSFSRFQVIQNSAPSTIVWRQCDIWIARKSVRKNSISRMSPACFCNLTCYFCLLFYWKEYKWCGFSSFQFIFLFYLKRSFLSSFFINKLGTILGLSFWGLLSRTFPSRLLNRACVRNLKLGVLLLNEVVNFVGAVAHMCCGTLPIEKIITLKNERT